MKNSVFLITLAYFAIVTAAETTTHWSKVIVDEPVYEVIDDVLVLEDKNVLNGTRIFGEPAKRNEFAFQVGLKLSIIPKVLSSWCSGVILSKKYILTAAHCLVGNKYELLSNGSIVRHNKEYQWAWYLDAYFGGNDLNQENEFQIKNVYSNPNFIINRDYYPEKLLHDVALVHMPEPIVFGEFVQPGKLASYDVHNIVGQRVFSSGWGLSSDYGSDESSRLLRFVELKAFSPEDCKTFYNFIQNDKHLCLTHYNKDPKTTKCQGDSGGPISIQADDGKKVVIGITSLGSGAGCSDGTPLVVTTIDNYLVWISENMKDENENEKEEDEREDKKEENEKLNGEKEMNKLEENKEQKEEVNQIDDKHVDKEGENKDKEEKSNKSEEEEEKNKVEKNIETLEEEENVNKGEEEVTPEFNEEEEEVNTEAGEVSKEEE